MDFSKRRKSKSEYSKKSLVKNLEEKRFMGKFIPNLSNIFTSH